MPPVGFKPTIPVSERPQTHALDRAATGIGSLFFTLMLFRTKILHWEFCQKQHPNFDHASPLQKHVDVTLHFDTLLQLRSLAESRETCSVWKGRFKFSRNTDKIRFHYHTCELKNWRHYFRNNQRFNLMILILPMFKLQDKSWNRPRPPGWQAARRQSLTLCQ
jgi:hypothetical protein